MTQQEHSPVPSGILASFTTDHNGDDGMNDPNQMAHPPAPQSGGGAAKTVLIVLAIVAVVFVVICVGLVALMLPALAQARQAAFQLQSQTHARMIAQGLIMYESGYGEMPLADAWADALLYDNYITPDVLEAPNGPIGVTAYFYVPMSEDAAWGQHILVYEHPGVNPDGGIVAYADGSSAFISEPEFSQIIGSLTLPDGTPYAPHEGVVLDEP